MTQNNLREHLTWLISSNTFTPPTPGPTPSDTIISQSSSSGSGYPLHGNLYGTIGRPNLYEPATYDGEAPPLPFAHPPDSDGSLGADSIDIMARLQSGTRSSTKSKLLSQALPGQLQTPITHLDRAPSISLTDQYNARYKTSAYKRHTLEAAVPATNIM